MGIDPYKVENGPKIKFRKAWFGVLFGPDFGF